MHTKRICKDFEIKHLGEYHDLYLKSDSDVLPLADVFENFRKIFFLTFSIVFGKTMENVRKHRDTKLVATERRRNYLISEPNYHSTKFFTENLLAIEMKKKSQILMNKPVYLRLSILDLGKIVMYEFQYDCIKPQNIKLCYMDTDSSIVHVAVDDIYKDIAKDLEATFGTSICEMDRPLHKRKSNNEI